MQSLPGPSCPLIHSIRLLPINIMLIFCRSSCKRTVKGSLSRFLGFPAKFCSIWGFLQCACWNAHHMRTLGLVKLSNTYLALRLWRNSWKMWHKCTPHPKYIIENCACPSTLDTWIQINMGFTWQGFAGGAKLQGQLLWEPARSFPYIHKCQLGAWQTHSWRWAHQRQGQHLWL